MDSELDKRIEMSALIPIVETEKSIGSRLVRRDSNGYYVTAPLPYGEHYQLNVVGYREVFIKDIVKSIENGQELVKGISDNNYNFELFEDYLDSTKINNISRDYLNSIIVEFGRKFGLDEEMIISVGGESVFKKVYRLVE